MIRKIKESSLYVKNLNETRRFYEEKLGFKVLVYAGGKHIFFQAGDSVLLCFLNNPEKKEGMLPYHYASGSIHLAFEVTKQDYFSCKEEIKIAGIEIIQEQEWKNGLKSFYFRDPDGHLLEIVQEGVWDL